MKFALRDDDLNYFFSPSMIEKYYKSIWDFCPVSMSVVPFIKGNWPRWLKEAEKMGPGYVDEDYLKGRLADNEVYPIHKNSELVAFVKDKIVGGNIYLTIHAIHHRNEDEVIPQFKNNYGYGAEFYTNRNLSMELEKAIEYIEKTFNQKIDVFTPPQNLLSDKGLNAVLNNRLAICADLPGVKNINSMKLLGINNYIKYFIFKLRKRNNIFPHVIKNDRLSLVAHQRLQPGSDISKIKREIDLASEQNGVFVLSTHSYAFDYPMKSETKKMGEVLIDIIEYAKEKPHIEFLNLNKIFE